RRVVENGRTVGMLPRTALVATLSTRGLSTSVASAMQPVAAAASPTDSLEATFQRMRESQAPIIPVEENGRLVGVLTVDNVSEFLLIRSALQHPNPSASGGSVAPAGEARREETGSRVGSSFRDRI